MEIAFNPAKDTANISKHGMSLLLAADLEWDWLLFERDTRRDYGEVRMIGYVPLGERVCCVAFTDRSETRHIISLMKANTREVKHYEHRIQSKT